MKALLETIEKTKRSGIKRVIDERKRQFTELGKKPDQEIFKELCFCLLTANYSAQGGITIQNAIGDGFLNLPEQELARRLSELGHRFPNARALYISEARKHKNNIKETLSQFTSDKEARNWLAENVKGLGMKEASHFLRNIGYKDIAIIDFHIVDLLAKHDLIAKPSSLNKKNYMEIENLLEQIGKTAGLDLGELDLYLWYIETGKVLK